jgi:hypothetical protein
MVQFSISLPAAKSGHYRRGGILGWPIPQLSPNPRGHLRDGMQQMGVLDEPRV